LENRETFLEDFKKKGFYLDDLVLTPINKWKGIERSRQRQEAVPELAKRLVEYNRRLWWWSCEQSCPWFGRQCA
jgi:hypothetical protein